MDQGLVGEINKQLAGEWTQTLKSEARRHGLGDDLVPVRGWLGGAMLVACVRQLGGSCQPAQPFHGWILRECNDHEYRCIDAAAPELAVGDARIGDFHGVVRIDLDGETFLALRTDEPVMGNLVERTLVLVGPSLQATMRLSARLAAKRREILRDEAVNVYGTARKLLDVTGLEEAELILPEEFRRDLLGFVDGFAETSALCRDLRIAPTRGALLVGAPGTGKTHTIRHLFRRLSGFRFFVLSITQSDTRAQSLFEQLLLELADVGQPSVVIIEDIDRLFESDMLTPQFFLNAVDGLFRPTHPVLWLSTSNDPRGLEANLLDRPGRFDRVFVFPMPGPEERRRFVRRFSPWPVAEDVIERVVRETEGLTGAHLREVCYSAALLAVREPATYAARLTEELAKVLRQHQRARNYDFALGGNGKVGFAVP